MAHAPVRENKRKTPDIPTLVDLSSRKIDGHPGFCARMFARDPGPDNLEMMDYALDAEHNINVRGRVPGIKPEREDIEVFKSVFGADLTFQRITGQIKTQCVLESRHDDGVMFSINSLAIPEMWLEIVLSPEQIRKAYQMINE